MEEGKVVTVCWSDHPQALLEGLWCSLLDKYKVDVNVGCKGVLVQAHQLILSIFCPGFKERLQYADQSTAAFHLGCDIERDDLDLVIEFIYKGKVTIPRHRLGGLQKAATDLQLQAMNDALERVLQNDENDKLDAAAGARVPAPRQACNRKTARKRKGKPVKISRIPAKRHASSGGVDHDDDGDDLKWKPNEKSFEDGNDGPRVVRPRKAKIANSKTAMNQGGEDQVAENGEEEEDDDDGEARKPSQSNARKKRWRMQRPQLQCPHCSYHTCDKMTYNSHIAKHDPNAERFTCETCSKTFRNQTSFRRHVRSHRDPDNLYKCPECAFRTPQRSTWIQHMAVIHRMDPEGRWLAPDVRCTQCDFTCLTEYQLKSHVARKHTTDKPHKCPECSYASIARSDIEKHVRIMHRKERPYMCEMCGVRSKTRNAFNMHVQSHSGLKPYKCEICGQAYTRSDKLKTHLLKHARSDGKFVCHLCGQLCNTRDHFLSHLKYDHPAAPEADGEDCGRGSSEHPSCHDLDSPEAIWANAYRGEQFLNSLSLLPVKCGPSECQFRDGAAIT